MNQSAEWLLQGQDSTENCTDVSQQWDPAGTMWSKLIFSAIYSLIFVFGLAGNGAIVWVTARNTSLQTVQNFFILNLTVADIFVCLLSVPVTPITNIYKEWFFGATMCYLIPWVQGASIFILTFTLAGIAINRFLLILFPHKPPMSRRTALVSIVLIWAAAIGITFPYAYYMQLGQVETNDGPFKYYCGIFCQEKWPDEFSRRCFTFFVLTAQFILPSLIIAFCYIAIMIRVSQRAKNRLSRLPREASGLREESETLGGTPNARPTTPTVQLSNQRRNVMRGRRRTTLILVLMVLIFILSWLPYQITQLVFEFEPLLFYYNNFSFHVVFLMFTLTHSIAMLGIVANPVLYAWLNLAFRDAILRRFCPSLASRGRLSGDGNTAAASYMSPGRPARLLTSHPTRSTNPNNTHYVNSHPLPGPSRPEPGPVNI